MEIAPNSVKTTLILAASPCIETHYNLHKIIELLDDLPYTRFYLSCDLKVQAMAAGIQIIEIVLNKLGIYSKLLLGLS